MRLEDLTDEQRTELDEFGASAGDRFEALDPDAVTVVRIADLPPSDALTYAAHRAAALEAEAQAVRREAVARARAAGLSWHSIALPLGVTAEGARRRYSRAS